MGLFDKIKGIANNAKEKAAQKQEEEKRRQEEAKRKQEEATRFNPDNKPLEWFSSEDGIKTFNEYVTAQNYILEETAKQEHESKHPDVDFDFFVSLFYKNAKLPSIYFKKFVDNIDVQALQFVGTTNLLVRVLSIQAKPFYVDDDGEPQSMVPDFTPGEIVSMEKNPALIFVKNFDCFELADDAQGSWDDKWDLWSCILTWIGVFGGSYEEFVSKNQWMFSKEVYLNELGTVRKLKGFCKKCIELAADEKSKAFFEEKYNECK